MVWRLLGVSLIVLLVCGCASRWEHATKPPAAFYDDDQACQALMGGPSKGIEPREERTSYESCMWEKGWHQKKTILTYLETPCLEGL
ncbi:MAG: hypothetical protein P8Y91_10885 [Desulfuromonadales bacterium]